MEFMNNDHSIWFENPSKNASPINTRLSYDLVSDGRPDVASPKLKTNYIDVPGTDGSLDFTEVLNGRKYQNRTGSWEFYVLNDKYGSTIDWSTRWRTIMRDLHGKHFERIWLVDEGEYDPVEDKIKQLWYYTGRIYVNEWKSDPQFSKIVLDYELEPYKNREPKDQHPDWLWDDLFIDPSVNPITYGTFHVRDTKKRSILNDTGDTLEITAKVKSNMKVRVEDDNIEYDLHSDEDTTFPVPLGMVELTFTGLGDVTLSYDGSTRSL